MDIKQTNQKGSLLHYLIKLLASRMTDLLTFYNDMPTAQAAAKCACFHL